MRNEALLRVRVGFVRARLKSYLVYIFCRISLALQILDTDPVSRRLSRFLNAHLVRRSFCTHF